MEIIGMRWEWDLYMQKLGWNGGKNWEWIWKESGFGGCWVGVVERNWEEFGEMMKRVWRFVFEGEKVGDRGKMKLERFGIVMVSVWEGNWCSGLGFI